MAEPAAGFTSVVAIRNKRPAADDDDGDDHDGGTCGDRPSKRPRSDDTPAQLAAQKREQSQWVIAVSESLPSALGKKRRRSADLDGDDAEPPLSGQPPAKRILLNLNSKKHDAFPRIARSVVSRFARDVAARTAPAVASAVSPVVAPMVAPVVASRAACEVPSHASRKAPSRAVPVTREVPSRAAREAASRAASRASRFAAFYKARVAALEAVFRERRDRLDVYEAAFRREARPRSAREAASRVASRTTRETIFREARDRLVVYEAVVRSPAFRSASFRIFLAEERYGGRPSEDFLSEYCDIR
jgi:hypothetical protein